MAKIFHTGDIHACSRHHHWVQRALSHAIDTAISEHCTLGVIAGDSFDSAISAHEPAFVNFIGECARIADAMPLAVIYGTQSHDRPGSLDVLRAIPSRFPIHVFDKPEQVEIAGILVSALPGLNKAEPAIMAEGPKAWARRVLSGFAERNIVARSAGIPSLLITHGTINGCCTESRFALVSPDHELDLETLAMADAAAVMAAHIHEAQEWLDVRTPSGATTTMAYCGSLARLVHGHLSPVGFRVWSIDQGKPARSVFHPSPARQLLEIAFDGPPDMDQLRALAATVQPDDAVRIRWSIDEEHVASVDKQLIREMFAAAETVKLEPRVLPVQRVRAAGIGQAVSLAAKLRYWAETAGSQQAIERLTDRLMQIQSRDPAAIVSAIVGQGAPVAEALREAA
jgi:DNA repair protein SbcD/Mre11